ncbi:MarR family winged helix-turn-helix transcriptional regulator [Bifidobacterium sp. ESL0819]|uniref:MarR family winged helix-turn-helix transcriptional regulator n=1 Tax=Bifidobacterium sp. ESL0819 TaxID=3448589 RepID=UPI0040426439
MLKKSHYHNLSTCIAGIYRHARNDASQYTGESILRGTQGDLIVYLYDHPGLSQRQIARDLCVDPSLLARDLKALKAQGLVSSEQNPADHRVNIIALTRPGADIARRRIRSINNWWTDLFNQNPDINPETFQAELRCVYNRLLANQL